MRPDTDICVLLMSSNCYICVRVLPYMCPHTAMDNTCINWAMMSSVSVICVCVCVCVCVTITTTLPQHTQGVTGYVLQDIATQNCAPCCFSISTACCVSIGSATKHSSAIRDASTLVRTHTHRHTHLFPQSSALTGLAHFIKLEEMNTFPLFLLLIFLGLPVTTILFF